MIASFTRSPASEGLEIVRDTWRQRLSNASGNFDAVWQEAVRAGVIPGTEAKPEAKPALAGNWAEGMPPSEFKEQLRIFAREVMPAFPAAQLAAAR